MLFSVITLFPNLFDSYLADSIIKRAIDKKILEIEFYNDIRNFNTKIFRKDK